ncbi:START-like domain-containing protein [Sediminitomix flava]|uniref:START-like domain-containing protein n=1 Tax=Sediminitomix flava TaxID=379075 RepID=A0A315Z7V8_SEDFL|nr:START-like domain-containing protein [Sediminitomix flava]PWJ40131.1 hypothetical protein BC781_105199 [Sediminitomix flava]
MSKFKYEAEFEVNAPVGMLFPYLSTRSGLGDWFADKVEVLPDKKTFIFTWEEDERKAKQTLLKADSHVKFEFEEEEDPSFFEFHLDFSEMTQTCFIRVVDYSDMDDLAELGELWSNYIDKLKTIVGA